MPSDVVQFMSIIWVYYLPKFWTPSLKNDLVKGFDSPPFLRNKTSFIQMDTLLSSAKIMIFCTSLKWVCSVPNRNSFLFDFFIPHWNGCFLYLRETHFYSLMWKHRVFIVYSKLINQVMRKVTSLCTELGKVPSVPNWNTFFMVPYGSIGYKDFKKVYYMPISHQEVGWQEISDFYHQWVWLYFRGYV